jgi:hypothetical protein
VGEYSGENRWGKDRVPCGVRPKPLWKPPIETARNR